MYNERYALRLYRDIHVIASIIIGVVTICNGKMYGEGIGLSNIPDSISLFLILLLDVFVICLTLPYYDLSKRIKILPNSQGIKHKLVFDTSKIHAFVLILLILQIVFSLKTGNGVVDNEHTASGSIISYILNALKVDAFIPIYYIVERYSKRKIFWINILLWVIYEIICGWTGFVLTIFIMEYYLWLKYNHTKNGIKMTYCSSIVISLIALLGGGFLYRYLYSIKNTIRLGITIPPLDYGDGLAALVSRMTSYPLDVVGVQNNRQIAALYNSQGVACADFIAIFRSLVPGSVMNKDFRTLNNIVLQSMYPTLANSTSSGYTLPILLFNLATANMFDFIVYIVVAFILMIASRELLYSFDNGSGDVDVLYYMLIFSFLTGGSLETVFAYRYIGLIYLIVIMLLLGVIKVEKYQIIDILSYSR